MVLVDEGHGVHIMQGDISGKIMRYAAAVGVVRYMMAASGRSIIARSSHVLSKTRK